MNSNTSASGNKSVLLGLFKLMRPKQWVKNGFVFAPLMFTGLFLDIIAVSQTLIAFALFSLAASATYVVNDLKDIEEDRKHPTKSKKRPLASGQVTPAQAKKLLVGLYGLLIVGFFIQPLVMGVIVSYLLLNVAYSYYLKHQPVLDIFTIAIGFVLRVYAGAVAISVPLSSWMFVTTLCLALYLAAIKRRQELVQTTQEGREVLQKYTVSLVDRYAEMAATGALLFYSLFVMNARPEMVITIPFVLFGLFRYWYVSEALGEGESPTDALLSDKQLLITVVGWIAVSLWALWPAGGM
ncbi:decaprenyl-phosphate phosphoribosyltransferase [Thiomicrorhabdus lithotrophica]|uniref:Decaprenyl-phosphate phosphoribosyltransferase n=1 Tax=Thiomicrorhabdus lithotrophica TaxID=2949997 RepID=A0ABY8CBP5_9GAMM|nr:decaprenyl-phosphate phosphoribosyltransferase [Thiomicrorhabdus lithotrophica]WEJ62100.1 decaprenyl-phosphate phosphoribosyltransferase [Thiomicrorhabdus lithotrophica]